MTDQGGWLSKSFTVIGRKTSQSVQRKNTLRTMKKSLQTARRKAAPGGVWKYW